jgi:hypothetical protein
MTYLTREQRILNVLLKLTETSFCDDHLEDDVKALINECRNECEVLATRKPATSRPGVVKYSVLTAVKLAYPNSILTSEVREYLSSRGMVVHKKTAGMYLYRLAKSGHIATVNNGNGRGNETLWVFVPSALTMEANADVGLDLSTDPRIATVRRHFHEWHGAAPDDTEIEALLKAIDETVTAEDTVWAQEVVKRHGH